MCDMPVHCAFQILEVMRLHANNRKLQGAACQAVSSLARVSLSHCSHIARTVGIYLCKPFLGSWKYCDAVGILNGTSSHTIAVPQALPVLIAAVVTHPESQSVASGFANTVSIVGRVDDCK